MEPQKSSKQDTQSKQGHLIVAKNNDNIFQDSSVPSNIFFHFIPQYLSKNPQEKLAVHQEVSLWQSWIIGSCETRVLDKVQKKELRADNTLQSQLQRASYRTRVIEAYLTKSRSWVADFGKDESDGDLVNGKELSTKIQQLLPDIGFDSVGFRKTLSLIAPYMSEIAHKANDEHSYYYMLANYEHNTMTGSFSPVIRTIFYSIKPAKKVEQEAKFHLSVTLSSKKFIQSSWSQAWDMMEDVDQKRARNDKDSLLASRTFNFAV